LVARVASVSLPVVCELVCLLDRVKLPVPRARPEPLDPYELLVAESRLRAQPRQLAEERSWDSQS
jgi:DsbC/DsbD-like thiol-disulfide interchange protein